MAIVGEITQRRVGSVTLLKAASNLTPTVYFHWYVDGVFVGRSPDGQYAVSIGASETKTIDVVDSTDIAFDVYAAPTRRYASRRQIGWIRSLDANIASYLVEQFIAAGSWATIATVPHDDRTWEYRVQTPVLADLAVYSWRVTPVHNNGNSGTALAIVGPLTHVNRPTPPVRSVTFDAGTTKVTFA